MGGSRPENPLGTAKLTSPTTKFLPAWKLSAQGPASQTSEDPRAHPRRELGSVGLLTRAPWLSASSPAAAPCLPWHFGMVPPFLHALYHSRAHPTAVPSRRMFAECLQVARQRSRELIFLLIKGRKISLFLNREKTTEGRAQKLFLSWRRDHRLESKTLSTHT